MEPLGAVTAVVSAVVYAAQAAQKLKTLVNEVRDAQDDSRDLGININSLVSILQGVDKLCSREEFQRADPLLLENLRHCVKECETASKRLLEELSPFKSTYTLAKRQRMKLVWIWHRSDRDRLKLKLFEARDNLDTAVLVMNGYISGKGYQDIREDIAALHLVIDRESRGVNRQKRKIFRRQMEGDLETVISRSDSRSVAAETDRIGVMANFLDKLEPGSFSESPPQIEAIPDDRPISLIQAVTLGDHTAIQQLLSQGGSFNQRSPEGQTALHLCVLCDDRKSAELLLNHDPSVIDIRNIKSLTPIQLAIRLDSWSVASLLIERGCGLGAFTTIFSKWINQQVSDLSTVTTVINALSKRRENCVEALLLVHQAVEKDNLQCLALLLENGFDANDPEPKTGILPIQIAVVFERMDHVKLLLSHGACLNKRIPDLSQTLGPFHNREYHKKFMSCQNCSLLQITLHYESHNPDMLNLLLANGEKSNFGDETQFSAPLNGLCAAHCWIYAEPLIYADANVNGRDRNGYTAMYWSVVCNNVPMIELLLVKGADINVKTEPHKNSLTPLHVAVSYDRRAVASLLIERGADVELTNGKGLTALQMAEQVGDTHAEVLRTMRMALEKRNIS